MPQRKSPQKASEHWDCKEILMAWLLATMFSSVFIWLFLLG